MSDDELIVTIAILVALVFMILAGLGLGTLIL
jgi:hypothetical protein